MDILHKEAIGACDSMDGILRKAALVQRHRREDMKAVESVVSNSWFVRHKGQPTGLMAVFSGTMYYLVLEGTDLTEGDGNEKDAEADDS
jgi:hypothetical protein